MSTKSLKTNPLFQFSLASRELFHSNFLYWIAMIDKGLIERILHNLGYGNKEMSKYAGNWEAKREYENFDFCLVAPDTDIKAKRKNSKPKEKVILVIENKVKSIPTDAQLKGYDEKLEKLNSKDAHRILLSLAKDFPDKQLIESGKLAEKDGKESAPADASKRWNLKYYSQLKKAIENALSARSPVVDDWDYYKRIIHDYLDFIEGLDRLADQWSHNYASDKNELSGKYETAPFNLPSEEAKALADLRILDLREKIVYSQMQNLLDRKLQEKGLKSKQITTEFGYTKSRGFVGVSLDVNFPSETVAKASLCRIGIQVQGEQYRHSVVWDKETTNRKKSKQKGVAEKEFEDLCSESVENKMIPAFFFRDGDSQEKGKIFPDFCESAIYPSLKKADHSPIKLFDSFTAGSNKLFPNGYTFLYQYAKIKEKLKGDDGIVESVTVEHIVDQMVSDIKKIIENIEKNKQ